MLIGHLFPFETLDGFRYFTIGQQDGLDDRTAMQCPWEDYDGVPPPAAGDNNFYIFWRARHGHGMPVLKVGGTSRR